MKVPLPANIEKQTDLDHSLLIKRTDGIIELRCGDAVNYTTKMVMENHAVLKEFAGSQKALVLTFAGQYTLVSANARSYTAKGPHKDYVAAEAFLINSLPQKLLGNFFLKVNKPVVPANVFLIADQAKAEQWLRKHKT